LTREQDVRHAGIVAEREQVLVDRRRGERGKAQRRDELGAAFGEDATQGRAAFAQAPDQFEAPVGRDPARHHQNDTSPSQTQPWHRCFTSYECN
jgi:hypothetical protein